MKPPATILVVDDNPVVRFKVVHLLKTEGFRVVEAEDGAGALNIALRESPDLVLLDVMLPDTHGVKVCRQLKANPATSRSFVVLVSEFEISPERQSTGLEAGADGYISRPIDN